MNHALSILGHMLIFLCGLGAVVIGAEINRADALLEFAFGAASVYGFMIVNKAIARERWFQQQKDEVDSQ